MLLACTAMSLLNATLAEHFLLAEDIVGLARDEPAVVTLKPGQLQEALDYVRPP